MRSPKSVTISTPDNTMNNHTQAIQQQFTSPISPISNSSKRSGISSRSGKSHQTKQSIKQDGNIPPPPSSLPSSGHFRGLYKKDLPETASRNNQNFSIDSSKASSFRSNSQTSMDTFDPFAQDGNDEDEPISFGSHDSLMITSQTKSKHGVKKTSYATVNISSSSSQILDMNQQLSDKDEQIMKLRKEIDDMKFFHELESGKESNNSTNQGSTNDSNTPTGHGSIATEVEVYTKQNEALRRQISRIESENSKLLQKNVELESSILSQKHLHQSMNGDDPKASSIYKKALKFQSELIQVKSTLQEEILSRERADTNLNCYKLENEAKLSQKEEEYNELRSSLNDMSKDLEEGVLIMKGLEEELLLAHSDMETERGKRLELEESIKSMEYELACEKERCTATENEIATETVRQKELEQKLQENTKELEEVKMKLVEEQQLLKDKESLDNEWSRTKAVLEQEILNLKKQHEEELELLTEQHGERIWDLEKELERNDEDLISQKNDLRLIEKKMATLQKESKGMIDSIEVQTAKSSSCEEKIREYEEKMGALKEEVENVKGKKNEVEDEHDILTQNLLEKEKELSIAKESVTELTEALKQMTSLKAKDHQYIREKKKWSSVEQKLRQELSSMKIQLNTYEQDLNQERSKLSNMVDHDSSLESQIRSMEETIQRYEESIKRKDEESNQRIKKLEKELFRAQSRTSIANTSQKKVMFSNGQTEHSHFKKEDNSKTSLPQDSYTKNEDRQWSHHNQDNISPSDNFSSGDEIMGVQPPINQQLCNVDWMDPEESEKQRSVRTQPQHKINCDGREARQRIENDQIRKFMQRQRQRKASKAS